MTNDEIYKKAEDIWKVRNTWGLSYDDFLRACYYHGDKEKGIVRENYNGDSSGDVVYISPEGSSMTRSMANDWASSWHTFADGFLCAWRYLEGVKQ